jgi:hypothetical protein
MVKIGRCRDCEHRGIGSHLCESSDYARAVADFSRPMVSANFGCVYWRQRKPDVVLTTDSAKKPLDTERV